MLYQSVPIVLIPCLCQVVFVVNFDLPAHLIVNLNRVAKFMWCWPVPISLHLNKVAKRCWLVSFPSISLHLNIVTKFVWCWLPPLSLLVILVDYSILFANLRRGVKLMKRLSLSVNIPLSLRD